jgi:hypothetical protein
MEEAYCLLENRNGFEEPLKAGTKRELEALQRALEKKEFLSNHSNDGETMTFSYFDIKKRPECRICSA